MASVLRSQQRLIRFINQELCHHAVLQATFAVGELDGCGLAALAYEVKTCENLFCGLFGLIYENLHQRKFPATQYVRIAIGTRTCTFSQDTLTCQIAVVKKANKAR